MFSRYLVFLVMVLWTQQVLATQVFLTSGSTWTVPSNWNSTGAIIECIGPGGNGGNGTSAGSTFPGGNGGQGGGYGRVSSPANIIAGNVLNISIGGSGSTTATYLRDNTSTTICQGDYGASAVLATGGSRSQTASGDNISWVCIGNE